jgi:hypothetical protein
LRRKWGWLDVQAATTVVLIVQIIAFSIWLSSCAVLP